MLTLAIKAVRTYVIQYVLIRIFSEVHIFPGKTVVKSSYFSENPSSQGSFTFFQEQV